MNIRNQEINELDLQRKHPEALQTQCNLRIPIHVCISLSGKGLRTYSDVIHICELNHTAFRLIFSYSKPETLSGTI
jgi:hypothetical protein